MKKQYARLVFTLACFLVLVVGVEAQTQREIIVAVPFEFVAAGKILPAGTYTVSRVSETGLSGLILSSYDTRSSVFLIPNEFDSYHASDAKVRFKQVGDMYFLSKIETAHGVYNVPVPRSAAAVAGMRHPQGMPASGAN